MAQDRPRKTTLNRAKELGVPEPGTAGRLGGTLAPQATTGVAHQWKTDTMLEVINPSIVGSGVAVGVFVGIIACLQLGRRIGARAIGRRDASSLASTESLETAVFALLGSVIAFTFSGALTRFEGCCARRSMKPTRSAPRTCVLLCCRSPRSQAFAGYCVSMLTHALTRMTSCQISRLHVTRWRARSRCRSTSGRKRLLRPACRPAAWKRRPCSCPRSIRCSTSRRRESPRRRCTLPWSSMQCWSGWRSRRRFLPDTGQRLTERPAGCTRSDSARSLP